ncbi:hypothetical protein QJS66_00355 [Kocuria rhizophila]|nr:hypothetical protein QJS66_00355 [Kocuria rhizophila]
MEKLEAGRPGRRLGAPTRRRSPRTRGPRGQAGPRAGPPAAARQRHGRGGRARRGRGLGPSNVQAALDVAGPRPLRRARGGRVPTTAHHRAHSTAGDDKDAARARLVELFDVVGGGIIPVWAAARAQLMRLF